jgi:hypothetical protein
MQHPRHSVYNAPAANKEKSIIRNAMIVFFLALLIVYILRYQFQGKDLMTQDWTLNTGWLQIVSDNSIADLLTTTQNTSSIELETNEQGLVIRNPDIIESNIQNNTGLEINTISTDTENLDSNLIPSWQEDIRLLSGTSLYFGPLDAIQELGISYKYALKDNQNIYYLYLGDEDIDLPSIARGFNGSLYIMNTSQEILSNQLFGDKITFINIPKYKDQQVFMVVEQGSDVRLIQIAYPIYHQSKIYLQNLFNNS